MKMRVFTFLLSFCLLSTVAQSQEKATRNLSGFDEIAISGGFEKVVLQEGNSESVSIEATGISPDDIVTEVKGSTLNIHLKKGSYRSAKIKLSVNYKSLKAISNSGSSDIEAITAIRGDRLEVNSSGSGDFKGAFDVKHLELSISGSSDMQLSGKADKQEIAISGSGDVDASRLSGSEAEVAISGSGDVSLHVNGPVQTAVSGSGKVRNDK